MARKSVEGTLDFAIVGGGMAGLYAAWRLSQHGAQNLRLYEAMPDAGGRVLTKPLPGMSHYIAELGAMRYTNRHLLLSGLIDKLGPSRVKPIIFKYDLELLHLRGQLFRSSEDPPFALDITERNKDIKLLIKHALACALSELDVKARRRPRLQRKLKQLTGATLHIHSFTTDEWNIIKEDSKLKGAYLRDFGLWNVLQDYLTTEAYLLCREAFGYMSILANWNAAEAIPWFLRDFDAGFRTLRGGMGDLVGALVYEIQAAVPGSIIRNAEVREINKGKDNTLKLIFADETSVKAKNVILAIPKRDLQHLRYHGFTTSSGERAARRFRGLLFRVNTHPLYKLFLGYRTTWWLDKRSGLPRKRLSGRRKECVKIGSRAGTDLPLRQVYYYGNDEIAGQEIGGMIMASYSDQDYVAYWANPGRPKKKRPPQAYASDSVRKSLSDKERKVLNRYGLKQAVVLRAHEQVKRLHPALAGCGKIPIPIVALGKEWPTGWHTWKPGVDVRFTADLVCQPFEPAKLFVCGEAFSFEQGWIEGALKTTEAVLSRLGIPKPGWIKEEVCSLHGFRGFEEYIST